MLGLSKAGSALLNFLCVIKSHAQLVMYHSWPAVLMIFLMMYPPVLSQITSNCEAVATELLKTSNPSPAADGKFNELSAAAFPSDELIKEATEIAEAGNKERKE